MNLEITLLADVRSSNQVCPRTPSVTCWKHGTACCNRSTWCLTAAQRELQSYKAMHYRYCTHAVKTYSARGTNGIRAVPVLGAHTGVSREIPHPPMPIHNNRIAPHNQLAFGTAPSELSRQRIVLVLERRGALLSGLLLRDNRRCLTAYGTGGVVSRVIQYAACLTSPTCWANSAAVATSLTSAEPQP